MSTQPIRVGVESRLSGVRLIMEDPDRPGGVMVLTVEPEFARRIAESLTLRSFECEDLRRENIGGGS